MPDLPDPTDLLRGLDALRGALVAPGNLSGAMPLALERAVEVTAAINRLSDEVAKLNAHVERALPLLESFDQHAKRTMPVIEALQQAETGFLSLRRTMRRAARDTDTVPDERADGKATDPDKGEDASPPDPR